MECISQPIETEIPRTMAITARIEEAFSMPLKPHDKVWYLSRCGVFNQLPPEEISRLSKNDMFLLKRGESLSWRDKADSMIYVVKSGTVKIVTNQENSPKETILAILGHGELFGQMPLLESDQRECRAVAMEDTTICEFFAADIEEMMSLHPELATRITKMIGARLRRIETRMSHLLFKDAKQRVAFILLDLLENWGKPHTNGGALLDLRVTHQDIANLSGLTRETVSVTLAEFDLDELIRTKGRKIIVIDSDRLNDVMCGKALVGSTD